MAGKNTGRSISPSEREDVERTFRLDRDIDRKLEKIARGRNASPNSVVNGVLRHFVDFQEPADRLGYQYYPRQVMSKLLESVPDSDVALLGKWDGKNALLEFNRFIFKKSNLKTAIETLQFLDVYGQRFKFDYTGTETNGETARIVLSHSMGEKWSLYYRELLRAILHELPEVKNVTLRTSPSEVRAEVKLQRLGNGNGVQEHDSRKHGKHREPERPLKQIGFAG